MPKVLVCSQFCVDALGLKNNPNLAPQDLGILCSITSHHYGASPGGDHQGRKDAKKRGLSAAIGSEQPKQLRGVYVE